jgi:hypothetical protein
MFLVARLIEVLHHMQGLQPRYCSRSRIVGA